MSGLRELSLTEKLSGPTKLQGSKQMITQYDESKLFKHAITAYFRRFGSGANRPSNSSGVEEIDGRDCFVLRNINGPLAIYRILDSQHLLFVNVAS